MKYSLLSLFGLFFLLSHYSCQNISAGDQEQNKESEEILSNGISILHDTTFSINGRLVTIQYPPTAVAGSILCLPGWNFSRTDVCDKSTFCSEAKKYGFILIFPEMGKSIYASSLYPETRDDWKKFPQLKFITDTMLPELQTKFALLKSGQNNFLYGISTGARGVAMIALHTAKLFKAGAALSGDYEQTKMPNDNLMKGYYGELNTFKKRWETDDPYLSSYEIKIPLYLAHGGKDKTVPTEQTKIFFNQLKKINPTIDYQMHIDEKAGHNYEFWNKETEAVLSFFKKNSK